MSAAARVMHSGSAGRGGFVVLSDLGDRIRVVVREHMGPGDLRVDLDGKPEETKDQLRARGLRQFEEQRLIAETLEQPWPRLDGETPDPAHHWQRAGFTDGEVQLWLQVGVPWAKSAAELRDAGVSTLDAWRQHEPDVTRGLAYARGELSIEQLLAEVDR